MASAVSPVAATAVAARAATIVRRAAGAAIVRGDMGTPRIGRLLRVARRTPPPELGGRVGGDAVSDDSLITSDRGARWRADAGP
ncbi:hypothetical protein Cph01nite_20690 [Cellulomonas phragmiteti]|uniref:Uncharacterized protein n=1 Tax=Cellulomonas phragmiteti TaxID=478780 RepID=A0ABQ4DLS9_9CELL|nr:hypothetical protein Cph01nite_20690 [Cellulomonas phragmiteti]